VDEIAEEIMNEYGKFHEHTCKKQYINYRKQLTEWLEKYGVSGAAQLCKEGARTKNAAQGIRSGVL
jgi:uncharacterized protein (DUF927 family)